MSLVEVKEQLIRIESKLDMLNEDRADHEKRIRRVEYSLWSFGGAFALVTAYFSKGGFLGH